MRRRDERAHRNSFRNWRSSQTQRCSRMVVREGASCGTDAVVVVRDIHTRAHLRARAISIVVARDAGQTITHNSGYSRDLGENSILTARRGSLGPSGCVVAALGAYGWDAWAERFGCGRGSCHPVAGCGFEEYSFEESHSGRRPRRFVDHRNPALSKSYRLCTRLRSGRPDPSRSTVAENRDASTAAGQGDLVVVWGTRW
jgi:hypothetical protein